MTRPLEDLQDEILDRIHAGEPVDPQTVIADHPEHAEALTAFFEVIAAVEGPAPEMASGVPGPGPARLGEFRIVREIGRGGMGLVYEAVQESLKRRVALKVLPPTMRLDPKLVQRFRREAEAAGRLRHAGIVPVFSVGEAAGAPFFAMELVEGVSLQDVVEARRAGEDAGLPTDPEAWRTWAVTTIAKVADALAYAHERGILHRDVKPGNILLDEQGEPRLTDFGLALDLQAPSLTRMGDVMGSPQYMSPEQAVRRKAPVDERSDIYSLAVTLYELLTLRLPYDGTTSSELISALVTGAVVPPRKADPSIPPVLEKVLLGALQHDAGNRYRSATDFADDLRASMRGVGPEHGPVLRSGRRKRGLVVGAVAIAAAIGLVGVLLNRSDGGPDAPPVEKTAAETVEQVMADYTPETLATKDAFDALIRRLQAIGDDESREALATVYRGYVAGPGKDDSQARAFLGYREFHHEIPEAIAFRTYPYLRAVERASERRWFGPEDAEDLLLAERAWEETLRHKQRLESGRLTASEDSVRALIAADETMSELHLATRWVEPYLIGYLSPKSLSEYDLLFEPTGEARRAKAEAIRERRTRVDALLYYRGRMFPALHDEYLRRFGEAAELEPLSGTYGGRPDLPPAQRSFAYGVPLVVLIWPDRTTMRGAHAKAAGMSIPPGVAGYFSPRDGWIHFFDGEEEVEKEAQSVARLRYELQNNFHEGTHQLQYWYARQKNAWRKSPFVLGALTEGMAERLGAAEVDASGNVAFLDVNAVRREEMRRTRKQLRTQGKPYAFFPLERLLSFTNFGDAARWVRTLEAKSRPPTHLAVNLFFQQAWALVQFLEAKHPEALDATYAAVVARDPDRPATVMDVFQKAMALGDENDWAELQETFEAYVRNELLK